MAIMGQQNLCQVRNQVAIMLHQVGKHVVYTVLNKLPTCSQQNWQQTDAKLKTVLTTS